MKTKSPTTPLTWQKSLLWLLIATACFHGAYVSLKYPAAGLLMFGYAFALIQLTDQPTVRRAFYWGLAAGYGCYAPQLFFFFKIFNAAAVILWLVLAFWIGLFAAIVCGCIRRWSWPRALWLMPVIWTGIEYFRSELYPLKFSWLSIGYALPNEAVAALKAFLKMGTYGDGFVVFAIVVLLLSVRRLKISPLQLLLAMLLLLFCLALIVPAHYRIPRQTVSLVGVQMEFPPASVLPKMLDHALAKNTNADIFVLSEYTLDGPVPDSLKDWCREHSRFLVVGGKDPVATNNYYNTAFVIGTNGEIVFKQAKSVPIQFFRDGLPATEQKVWESPWGKIGICVCYDLSYTRVTDELVRQGAQLLIVPTMDVESWGRHQHELHARIAPVRAVEYGIPIFRLCSSGISQAVTGAGSVVAEAPMPGNGQFLATQLRLPAHGRLPADRVLAPICAGITTVATSLLLLLTWWAHRLPPELQRPQ